MGGRDRRNLRVSQPGVRSEQQKAVSSQVKDRIKIKGVL